MENGAVLLRLPNVKLREGDAKSGAKSVKGTVTLTETTVIHTARDGHERQVSLRRVLKQMHSMPGAKNPMLALKLKDESKDDFKFTFQSEAEKDQMKEMVSQCLVNPINTAEGAAAAAAEAAKAKRANVVAIGGDPSSARPGQDLLQTREAAALKENPVLLDLMKETTKDGGAFTKAEFWQGYDLEGKASSAGAASADAPIQIGISSDVLSKFKPQQQRTSQEGTTYRITKDMQGQIFQMYPKLKKVYDEKVTQTHEWQPATFWDTAVKSELFHRGTKQATLTAIGANSDITELFALCRQREGVSSDSVGAPVTVVSETETDGTQESNSKRRRLYDPRYDLDATEDRDVDGYGLTTEPLPNKFKQRSRNRIDVSLINEDSQGILTFMTGPDGPSLPPNAVDDPYAALRNTEHLDDLDIAKPVEVRPLHFSLASIAAHVAANTTTPNPDDGAGPAELGEGCGTGRLQFRQDPSALTPTGFTARGAGAVGLLADCYMQEPSRHAIPVDLATEVKKYDVALSLVMRHFWMCFPPSAPPPELNDPRGKKASRLKGTLEKDCLEQRLLPLKERIAGEHPDDLELVANLEARVRQAIEYADRWKVSARKALLESKRAAKGKKRKVREGEA